jgi:3',5'-cyclic AMP phosphodiesterase CpdA
MGLSKLRFVHIGDMHVPDDPPGFFRSVNESGVDFIITGGDNVQSGMDFEYETFQKKVAPYKKTLYIIRGNHDRGRFTDYMERFLPENRREPSNGGSRQMSIHIWNGAYWDNHPRTTLNLAKPEPIHYPFYEDVQEYVLQLRDQYEYTYAFEKKGWRFIVLDSSLWIMSDNQVKWLKKELRRRSKIPTIVFIHHSLLPCGIVFDAAPLWNRWEILDALASAPCVRAVFHGHLHMSRIWNYRGIKIVCTGLHRIRYVTLGEKDVEDITPLEKYENNGMGQEFENRYFFITGRTGRMFLLKDKKLLHIRREGKRRSVVPMSGYIWAEKRCSEDVGVEWKFFIDESEVRKDYRLGVNFAVSGRWALQVIGPANQILEERKGTGKGDYRVEEIVLSFYRSGTYRIRFFQPAGQHNIQGRVAYFALVAPVSPRVPDLQQRMPR